MVKRLFKYYPQDFGALPVKVLHMNLTFDVFEDHTIVTSQFTARVLGKPLKHLEMNAKNLEIQSVSNKDEKNPVKYEYHSEKSILVVSFQRAVSIEEEFTLLTQTICKPTKHLLEGLYYDETPSGCPPTQITQCQQWGFQRLVPCLDDMTAKCTYRTTIIADKKYTHLITNGDLVEGPDAVMKDRANDRVKVVYDNTKTPMAPYLFFLGVGTYASFQREFEYPDGTSFVIELLASSQSDKQAAMKAVETLHDAILWVYLFTGPDHYKNEKCSREIWKLAMEREQLKQIKRTQETIEKLSAVRKKLKELSRGIVWGYKYTGRVYREIGMQNSDFGGMENVGNTTITANRIMPFPEMTDGSFEYMVRVKVHEYYHNLNGSEVTGWSPFEIWLNEAVTVYIEEKYHAFLFGEDYCRLQTVLGLLSPDRGTLLQDEGAASMPIEPDGFNDPNELITSITYVKAPEYVRMIETIIGKDTFARGLDLYHCKYKHGNATRRQWIECMEEVSGVSLREMSEQWLKSTAFPRVVATGKFQGNESEYHISLEQVNATPQKSWSFPLNIALLDSHGKVLAEKVVLVNKNQQEVVFTHISQPAIVSLNRGYSFYGKLFFEQSREELFLQAQKDSDIVARFMAWHKLVDLEKEKLLLNLNATIDSVDNDLLGLYFTLLNDEKLMARVGIQFLSVFESVENENYAHKYQDLYHVKKLFLKAVATRYKKELLKLYHYYARSTCVGTYMEQQICAIKDRQMKNTLLSVLATLDTPEVHALLLKQFASAKNATDKVIAFRLYLNSSAADVASVMRAYQSVAQQSLVSWETFLSVVGSNDHVGGISFIKAVEASPSFRIEQSNDQRALYGGFANNKKRSLQTVEGRVFLKELLLKLAKVNEYSTVGMLKVFSHVDKMDEEYHAPLIEILVELLTKLNVEEVPSVYNTAKRILLGLPKAKEKYEQERGKIKGL